jgi:hypothetical protein
MNGEVPKPLSDVVKKEQGLRALELREEAGRYASHVDELVENLGFFEDTDWITNEKISGLSDEQKIRINNLRNAQDPTSLAIRGYAASLVDRLMSPQFRQQKNAQLDFGDFSQDHALVKKYVSDYGGGEIKENDLLAELVVFGVQTQLDGIAAELDRAALMQDSQTATVRQKMFNRQENDTIRQLGLDSIDISNEKTYVTPRQIRERIVDAAIMANTDPRGFTRAIEFIANRSPRLRIFVPDAIRLLEGAGDALDKTYGVLKTATSADKPAERAIEAGLTGEQLRSIVAMKWKPELHYSTRFEMKNKQPIPAKDAVGKKEVVLGTTEALDYLAGNVPEFASVSPGKYLLRLKENVGSYGAGDEIDLWSLDEEIRTKVLHGEVLVEPTYKKNEQGEELTPLRPGQIIPGERLLTLPAMIREMDGATPLREFYLRSAGVKADEIIGYSTKSGLGTEASAVLSWNEPLLAATSAEQRAKMIAVDLLTIRAGAFMTRAMQIFGITQYDAFFDPACRAKQHLESSMRSVIPNEYWERHAIMDATLREAALSLFGALTGRKIQMNALHLSMSDGYKAAKSGEDKSHSGKRILEIVDPYQLEDEEKYLGLVRFHQIQPGASEDQKKRDIEIIEEQNRILDSFTITRREFVGFNRDLVNINRLISESRFVEKEYLSSKSLIEKNFSTNKISAAEKDYELEELKKGRDLQLDGLRRKALSVKRDDYTNPEENGGYYVKQRSPFEHPRPAVEQAAMLHAMTRRERGVLKDVSFKALIESMGGPKNLDDWAYEGWYGYMMTLEYAQSWGMFFWGDDAKIEQMQLKYMGKAGEAFGISTGLVEGLIQALDPATLKAAGLDVGRLNAFKPDQIGEFAGNEIATAILNSRVSGGETVRDYFKKLGQSIVGYAKSLPWLPGEQVKRQMRMFALYISQVVDASLLYHWKFKSGLGSFGSEKKLITLSPDSGDYAEVDKFLVGIIRQCGDGVVFPDNGDKPYVTVKGHRVAYEIDGEIDKNGKWGEREIGGNDLKLRYAQKRLELFSTNLTARVMEEFLRDAGIFDVQDKLWISEALKEVEKVRRESIS